MAQYYIIHVAKIVGVVFQT